MIENMEKNIMRKMKENEKNGTTKIKGIWWKEEEKKENMMDVTLWGKEL